MSTKLLGAIGASLVVIVLAVVALSSGGGNETTSSDTDAGFITEMVPHHQSAVGMAKIAVKRADHPQIRTLANNIIAAQTAEIKKLDRAHQRLFGTPVSSDRSTLGMPAGEMGMSMDPSMLATARPFDREFIDMMIPHHQGAIRMARIELASGGDPEMMSLAQDIISAQSAEIKQMNAWRSEWYGAPSPAGGVPSESNDAAGASTTDSTSSGSMDAMNH